MTPMPLGSGRHSAASRRSGEAGFLLPLSFGTALVLLLSSLSVQTAALQGSALAAAELRQRQLDDALASAAQQVAARLSGAYACLLPLLSTAWIQPVPGCAPELDPAPLLRGTVGSSGYRLVSWRPAGSAGAGMPGELRLELVPEATERLYAVAVAPVEPPATASGPVLHVLQVRGMGR